MSDALKVADIGVQARGRARRDSRRNEASGCEMTRANVCFNSEARNAGAMRTSMSMVISRYDLSALWASASEALDNLCDLQYGLELVIPMSSRRLEKR